MYVPYNNVSHGTHERLFVITIGTELSEYQERDISKTRTGHELGIHFENWN